MATQHYRSWSGEVNTRPIFSSNADLNQKSESIKVDFQERISSDLKALAEACDTYDTDGGKTARELAEAKADRHRLLTELAAAERKLKELETQGSALDRFNGSVNQLGGAYQKVMSLFTASVENSILSSWFGGSNVSVQAVSADRRRELRMHKRISDLQKFKFVDQPFTRNVTADAVRAEANRIGNLFSDLRAHIQNDTKA
jgi:hypothetical protein